ncbi:LysE family translocator [Thalassospiraceae bacterium LMO-JJ14]|nr:LysE family translocator [Thalassospiraceae bacterium LMO-JJ14]
MEIDFSTLGIFIAASFALYIAPGPDMIYVATRAMGQGKRAGVLSALGVSSGILVHMFAAAFGLAALLKVWPAAFILIKWVGIAYLVYLGLRVLLSKAESIDLQPARTARNDWRLYRQGFFCNILNPKIAIFFLAFLPQFTDAALGDVSLQMLFYGAVFASGGLVWILFIAYAFGSAGNWFARHPGALKFQKWITGSSMLGLALFVALDEGA